LNNSNKIKAEKIPVVFHIELSNEKMADAIAEETGATKLLFYAAHNISGNTKSQCAKVKGGVAVKNSRIALNRESASHIFVSV
jgi:hypothetical protein